MVLSLHDLVMSHEVIYSLFYGSCRIGNEPIEDQITTIPTKSLKWAKDGTSFFYVWGWPGPDVNKYSMQTYGKAWALTKQEIIDAWKSAKRN